MLAAGNSWAITIVSFIMDSRVKEKLLGGMLLIWWEREKNKVAAYQCHKLVAITCYWPQSVTWPNLSQWDEGVIPSLLVQITAMEGNRTFLDGGLFPGNSLLFVMVLGHDLCKDISFSFYSLATSEEVIKEYALLESSEGFSVYFMPIEVLIPKWG